MNTPRAQSINHVCVFRNGQDYFALDANNVRSVSPSPELTPVPYCENGMSGLAYLHKAFLPVYQLDALTSADCTPSSDSKILLSISLDNTEVGLLVDQVIGLESPEISYTTNSANLDDWNSVIVGTATCFNGFVSVIDPRLLAKLLQKRMEDSWSTPEAALRGHVGESEQTSLPSSDQ